MSSAPSSTIPRLLPAPTFRSERHDFQRIFAGEHSMARSRRKHAAAAAREDILHPTPERLRRGGIERLARPIADEAGRSARPYRASDTLEQMVRRQTITPAMRQAGRGFPRAFPSRASRSAARRRPPPPAARGPRDDAERPAPGGEAEGLCRDDRARRHLLARGLLHLARHRLRVDGEGVGAPRGLERPPPEAGDRCGNSRGRARRAAGALWAIGGGRPHPPVASQRAPTLSRFTGEGRKTPSPAEGGRGWGPRGAREGAGASRACSAGRGDVPEGNRAHVGCVVGERRWKSIRTSAPLPRRVSTSLTEV